MSGRRIAELSPERYAQLQALQKRAKSDKTYRALVDMYRNVSFEPEPAAHWMALHDIETYVHEGSTLFRPLAAGYTQAELEFLVERGIRLA